VFVRPLTEMLYAYTNRPKLQDSGQWQHSGYDVAVPSGAQAGKVNGGHCLSPLLHDKLLGSLLYCRCSTVF